MFQIIVALYLFVFLIRILLRLIGSCLPTPYFSWAPSSITSVSPGIDIIQRWGKIRGKRSECARTPVWPEQCQHASLVRVKTLVNTRRRTRTAEWASMGNDRSDGWALSASVPPSFRQRSFLMHSLTICTLIAITAVAAAVAVAAIDAPIFPRFDPSENCHAVREFIVTFNIRSRSLLFIARRK